MIQPLLIGPDELGVQNNYKPFMIPEKAFSNLFNAYVFRGRVQKKFGYAFQGRLRRVLTAQASGNITTGGAGTFNFNLKTAMSLESTAQFEPGSTTSISIAVGIQTLTDMVGTGTLTVVGAGAITAATFNYSTGVLTITASGAFGPVASTFTGAYYPGLPVMGLRLREQPTLNSEQTVAFDTKYAYRFTGGLWTELPSTAPTTWNGADYQLFYTVSYSRDPSGNDLFWATNYNTVTPDPIRYYDGTTWNNFAPSLNGAGTNLLRQCLLLVPYKDRLVALNTYEETAGPILTKYPQRARWSQNGSPIDPIAQAWRDDIVGRGGYVDAPTNEQIVSAGFIKDNLVVYFERSTWQLTYTGNEVLPFIWSRINQELGAESTFSNIVFDNGLLAFGNVGVHICNSVSVTRIDEVIPLEIFNVQNANNGPQRVYAVRDWINELVYFTYPDKTLAPANITSTFKFPNKVLVYNYRNNTFSFFEESFTCYGYFQRTTGLTWADLVPNSGYSPWAAWLTPWNSGISQSEIPDIVAGNQQGFILRFNPDNTANSQSRFIASVSSDNIESPTHNVRVGDYIQILNCIGSTNLNDLIVQVLTIVDENNFTIDNTFTGTYLGNGVFKVLSNINIVTKEFIPYWTNGKRYRLNRIEYLLDKTQEGEVEVDIFVDTGDDYSVTDPANGVVLGTNTLYTKPETQLTGQQSYQNQIWHRMYYYIEGETYQIQITMNDTQMRDLVIAESPITLHGMVMHFEQAGDFL